MNVAHIITAATFAIAAGSSFAHDDVQQYPTPSTATRAEVLADVQESAEHVRYIGDATVFVDGSDDANRSRAEVSAEARQAARENAFNPLFVGA
jgi:hypothetical protein